MPGKQLASVVEMPLRRPNRVKEADECRSISEADVSKDGAFMTDPTTPDSVSCDTRSTITACVPGSLIHISRSADGKLMWLPPSSSTMSSITHFEGTGFLGCDPGSMDGYRTVTLVSSMSSSSESSARRVGPKDLMCYENAEYSEIRPASPSAASVPLGHVVCEASQLPESSFQSSKTSELSIASRSENSATSNERATSSSTHGITPYLSSKLKPGRHILGVKRNQIFIRPGQLRHWATGKSPSKHANLLSPTKGKACRFLTF